MFENVQYAIDEYTESRLRMLRLARRRWKARRALHVRSHGHATEDGGTGDLFIWGACYTKKGRIRDVRIDLDQMGAARLYDTLRKLGYGDE